MKLSLDTPSRAGRGSLGAAFAYATGRFQELSSPLVATMFTAESIGVVYSPFSEAQGTPIQPFAAGAATGMVEIFEPFAEGLRDLEGFDRIWILYWCHRACAAKLTVVPYRDTSPHGVFATRAPSRPNPIGLSNVCLLGIDGRFLRISQLDILHGTPVLDVKPYVPQYDSYPNQRCGWLDRDGPRRRTRIADDRFERANIEPAATR